MNKLEPPGKHILASDLSRCTLLIGPVHVSIDVLNIQILVDCVMNIQQIRKENSHRPIASNVDLSKSEWNHILYDDSRSSYNLGFRGIIWEVTPNDLDKCISDDALPFLARGTVNKLMGNLR